MNACILIGLREGKDDGGQLYKNLGGSRQRTEAVAAELHADGRKKKWKRGGHIGEKEAGSRQGLAAKKIRGGRITAGEKVLLKEGIGTDVGKSQQAGRRAFREAVDRRPKDNRKRGRR